MPRASVSSPNATLTKTLSPKAEVTTLAAALTATAEARRTRLPVFRMPETLGIPRPRADPVRTRNEVQQAVPTKRRFRAKVWTVSGSPSPLRARLRAVIAALEHLVGGLGTAVLALVALLVLALSLLLCLVGVGLVLVPSAVRFAHVVAERERARLSAWGPAVISPGAVPRRLRDLVRDPTVHRETAWTLLHGVVGSPFGLLGLTIALSAVRDATFPLWWRLVPEGQAAPSMDLWEVHGYPSALLVCLLGVGWLVLAVVVLPTMARLQAIPGRRLLRPAPGTDLALRVAHLTATRAAALDAHSAELRRIERALHDGTQNRLVAVTVLVGAARRALARGVDADETLGRAQDAAEEALTELRAVVRSILPPVLTDRSLAAAVTALAAASPVRCRVDADLPGRCAASVEASAYFMVSEALTNVAKHSHATRADVVLRRDDALLHVTVTDDGRGGATESSGSGIDGIRRRVEAHDGTFALASPAGGPTTVTVSLPCGL